MKYTKIGIAALACITLAYCTAFMARPKVIMFGPAGPPKPADAQIQVFSTTLPDKPYIEIAEITCGDTSSKWNMEQILIQARKIGADAVILKGNVGSYAGAVPVGNMAVAVAEGYGLRAVAIRWK
jgi:hypothetical protein